MELCPAMRANVQASQPDSPSRVRNVWRRLYNTNGRTPASRRAFLCCFLRLDGSTCPLDVGAVQIQPSRGLATRSQRFSRIALTRGVIGSTRRAAAVFPCVTSSVPLRPFAQVIDSQRRRYHSSGRIPVSIKTVAIEASNSDPAPR